MSADPSLFVFGHFADPEHLAQRARSDLAGLFHGSRIEPPDPRPGEAVRLTFTSAVDVALDGVSVFEPGQSGTERDGKLLAEADYLGVKWDELAWRYVNHWGAELARVPAGSRVRYTAVGSSSLRREKIYADTQPGERPTVFGFDVDELSSPDWIHDAVVYQIFVDRFFDPGVDWGRPMEEMEETFGGTLRGVTAKLDYLENLGINVIWLTPIFESETYHGYDALDFVKIAAHLGGDESLRDLTREAHARGIRILLDLAANHCSWHNPKFVHARTHADSPYRDWFVFTDWPDEYDSFFGLPDLPHLNGDNPEVVEYMSRTASRYLIDFDVDGFRLDYALGPSLFFWTQFRTSTKRAKSDSFTVGEATTGPGELRKFQGRLDGCLDFPMLQAFRQYFLQGSMDAAAFHSIVTTHESYFAEGFVLPTFLDNHDMNRFLWAADGDIRKLKLAALCQMSLPQPPIIYYGTEIGLSQLADVGEIGFAASRLPMKWGDDVGTDLFAFYRSIISIRHKRPSLRYGRRNALLTCGGLYAYACIYDDEKTIVVLNASSDTVQVHHDSLVGTDLLSGDDILRDMVLAPYAGALVGVEK